MKTNIKKFDLKAKRLTRKFYKKAGHKPRYEAKSEVRYRILENTMRGYFNYSI